MFNTRKRQHTGPSLSLTLPALRSPYSLGASSWRQQTSGARHRYIYAQDSPHPKCHQVTLMCLPGIIKVKINFYTPLAKDLITSSLDSLSLCTLRDIVVVPGYSFSQTCLILFPSQSIWGQRDQTGLFCQPRHYVGLLANGGTLFTSHVT